MGFSATLPAKAIVAALNNLHAVRRAPVVGQAPPLLHHVGNALHAFMIAELERRARKLENGSAS